MSFPLIDALGAQSVFSIMCEKDYESTKGDHFGPHQHPHGEFFLLRSGHLKSYTNEGRWLIPAGHLCWVPPYSMHGGQTDDSLGIRLHLAAKYCQALPKQPGVVSGTPLIHAIVERFAEADGLRSGFTAAEEHLLTVLADEVERARTAPIVLPMPQDVKLRKIAEKWLAQPDDRTGIDELAEEVGMSRRSFTRNFKLNTGLSVGDWRQIARLMQGIEMLSAGKSVTETAFALGFDSISSFIALCQRHTGMSPKLLARSAAPAEQGKAVKAVKSAKRVARTLIPQV